MPSIHPFYGFAGLEYAQPVSAFIHQWGAGIIKNHFYTKDVSRVEEETQEMGRVAASETLEQMLLPSPQPHQQRTRQAHSPKEVVPIQPTVQSSKGRSTPAQMTLDFISTRITAA